MCCDADLLSSPQRGKETARRDVSVFSLITIFICAEFLIHYINVKGTDERKWGSGLLKLAYSNGACSQV